MKRIPKNRKRRQALTASVLLIIFLITACDLFQEKKAPIVKKPPRITSTQRAEEKARNLVDLISRYKNTLVKRDENDYCVKYYYEKETVGGSTAKITLIVTLNKNVTYSIIIDTDIRGSISTKEGFDFSSTSEKAMIKFIKENL